MSFSALALFLDLCLFLKSSTVLFFEMTPWEMASSSVAHELRTVDAQVETSDKTWQNLETLRLPFNNACLTLVEQLELVD